MKDHIDLYSFKNLTIQCRHYVTEQLDSIGRIRNSGLPEDTKFFIILGKFHLMLGE